MLLGPGVGLALIGAWRRALGWLGVLVVCAIATTQWPLFWLVAGGIMVAIMVDTIRIARRSTQVQLAHAALMIAVCISLALGLRVFAVETYRSMSQSMAPTLVEGDHLIVDKLSIQWRAPAKGDIVAFEFPRDPRVKFVKRVVAQGGDRVAVRAGVLYVNGLAISQQDLGEERVEESVEDHTREETRSQQLRRVRERMGASQFDTYQRADQHEEIAGWGDYPTNGECGDGTAPLPLAYRDDNSCEVPANALFVLGDNRDNSHDSRFFGAVRESAVVGRVTGIWLSRRPGGSIRWERIGRRP